MTRKSHQLFVLAIFATLSGGCDQPTTVQRAERDEVQMVSADDREMNKAFKRASASLDEFFRIAASPPPGTSHFAVKVRISDGRKTEYFWVNTVADDGAKFTGILGNEPRLVKNLKLGERITFDREQIVDWTFIDRSKGTPRTVGNFTACALLTKEPPAQAQEFKERYGLTCE